MWRNNHVILENRRMSRSKGVIFILTIMMAMSSTTFDVCCVKLSRNLTRALKPSVGTEIYRHAAVATDSPKCSEIGRDILQKKNGTAVDAAVATSFCLGLLAMHSTGIGGGGVMLIYKRASKTMEAIDYRETAPGKSRKDMFVKNPGQSRTGALAVAIPGEVKGLHEAHRKYGKLRWKDLLQPTIKMAENGFMMSFRVFHAARTMKTYLEKDAGMRDILFKDDKMVASGRTIVNKQLAETLKQIADNPNDFYNGSLATAIVKDIQDAGGIITLDDLANYKVKTSKGLIDQLGDSTLHTTGAPTGGPIVTHILNILKGYKFTKEDLKNETRAIRTYHRIIEAFKFGYAQKTKEGDPAFMDKEKMKKVRSCLQTGTVMHHGHHFLCALRPPDDHVDSNSHFSYFAHLLTSWLRNMTSKKYGSYCRLKITEDQTHNATYYGAETDIPTDHGTTHLSIVAENGDAVSLTSTINHWYGSLYRSLRTGILYNNEMDDFSTPGFFSKSGYPPAPLNFIQPNKRPVSSMAPLILTDKKGDVKIVLGASGGTKIITAVVQALMYMTWFGDNLSTAIGQSRIHHELFPNTVFQEVDRPLSKRVLKGLRKKGYEILSRSDFTAVQAILVDKSGRLHAKCDPRKNGRSFGY